jgi:hypothetical protein
VRDKDGTNGTGRVAAWEAAIERRLFTPDAWRWWFLALWLGSCAWLLYQNAGRIHWFALSDTDDNMRFAQVRAWLGGQGWYDLRQHRMDPPNGISIHWSRIVDLPIAGLILLFQPFVGAGQAARWACAAAPLIPLGVALYGLMLVVRRLVEPWAFLLAWAILMCAPSTMGMFMPLRIDHHGWQLATLMFAVVGMSDPKRTRGGVISGLSTAISLSIGLELLPYLATAGALIALWWVLDREQADRLRAYGISLAGGATAGYALFASYDNAQPLCDALTPVYLSTLLEAGAAVVILSVLRFDALWQRAAATAVVGALILGIYAASWPQCLGRPEHISPELDHLWFRYIKEAKPLYEHDWRISLPIVALSVIGLGGSALAHHMAKGTEKAMPWLLVALLSFFSTLLLLWQTRAGPASQLMGVLGATAIGQPLLRWTLDHRIFAVKLVGSSLGFIAVSGSFAQLLANYIPRHETAYRQKVTQANRRCPTLPALAPINRLPATTVMTFVDLGPRLISVTHHSAIAGPYHRAGNDILDIQHAFRDDNPEVAHEVMRRHGATLLLLCPGMSESTIYQSENPKGFYVQLKDGHAPAWLKPLPLPPSSPFRLWRRVD